MTKLQKNPPPAYSSNGLGVPYENIPQSAQMPVQVTTAVLPSSYNELPSTNPFSPNFSPQPVPATQNPPAVAAQLFSPVSPIAPSAPMDNTLQPSFAPHEPLKPNGNRKPNILQRLDGTPYPNTEEKPKQVRVARDMFDGALPPSYKRQGSDPARPGDLSQPTFNTHECLQCGKKRTEGQTGPCTGCGKRKSNPTAAPSIATTTTSHARHTSAGVASQRSLASSTTAGPSSTAGSSSSHQMSCNKCGRHKRPGSLESPITSPHSHSSNVRLQQAGLSIQPNHAGSHVSMYPQIDIIPPSATTFRPQSTFASVYGEEAPLVNNQPAEPKRQEHGRSSFRNNSIVRSLSRRLSRKEKEKAPAAPTPPLPSQQFSASASHPESDSQTAGRLINMISSTIPDSSTHSRNGTQYSKLEPNDDRPGTPFSFVEGPDENDGFEMTNMGNDTRKSSQHGLLQEPANSTQNYPSANGEYFPAQEERLDVVPRPKTAEPQRNYLSPDDAESRPQITRFKSLRSGVNKVNAGIGSISRSQSLKRLGSVKTVHHAWYRDGTDENSVPVF